MKKIIFALMVLFISSCATIRPPADAIKEAPESQKIKRAKDIRAFTLQGKIAARDDKDGFSANFYWTQSSKRAFSVTLFGPMGASATRIKGNGQNVTIQSQGKTYHSDSLDSLMRSQLGYAIPIDKLYFWLRGLRLDGQNINNAVHEGNWQIQIGERTKVNQIVLPEKLKLNNNKLNIKLKINSWVFR